MWHSVCKDAIAVKGTGSYIQGDYKWAFGIVTLNVSVPVPCFVKSIASFINRNKDTVTMPVEAHEI